MSVQQYKQVGYGLTQALIPLAAFPITSSRAPLTTDKAQLGTIWVYQPSNSAYVLVSIVNNSATWVNVSGGSGSFTNLTVTNLTVTGTSNLEGAVTAGAGMTVTTGNVTLDAGNLIVDVGNVIVTTGSISVPSASVAGEGLIVTGDIGAGTASEIALTNVTNTTQGGGALTLMATTAFPGTNTGFIKIYVGTTVAYIPYFTNISPT